MLLWATTCKRKAVEHLFPGQYNVKRSCPQLAEGGILVNCEYSEMIPGKQAYPSYRRNLREKFGHSGQFLLLTNWGGISRKGIRLQDSIKRPMQISVFFTADKRRSLGHPHASVRCWKWREMSPHIYTTDYISPKTLHAKEHFEHWELESRLSSFKGRCFDKGGPSSSVLAFIITTVVLEVGTALFEQDVPS